LCRPESSFNWSGSSRAGLGRGEAGAQGGTQGVEWRTLQDPPDVTALLFKWAHGDETALERLIPVVHRELHHIARRCTAGERSGHSFQATALVNEAYMRLVDDANIPCQGRAHFLGVAARIMRRILVDHARARLSQKRGGQAVEVTFDEGLIVTDDPPHDIVALDDALEALAKFDSRKSRVIELRSLSCRAGATRRRTGQLSCSRQSWRGRFSQRGRVAAEGVGRSR
jgi:RNA polymerase sigma-70 factor, ECF subfamily